MCFPCLDIQLMISLDVYKTRVQTEIFVISEIFVLQFFYKDTSGMKYGKTDHGTIQKDFNQLNEWCF